MYYIDDYNELLLQVQYLQDDCERDKDLYECTDQEFKLDFKEGNLFIKSKWNKPIMNWISFFYATYLYYFYLWNSVM